MESRYCWPVRIIDTAPRGGSVRLIIDNRASRASEKLAFYCVLPPNLRGKGASVNAFLSTCFLSQSLEQRVHHRITAQQLIRGDEFVRLVCLINRSGPTDDARYPEPAAEQSAFGAEAHLDALLIAGQGRRELHDVGIGWGVEARILIAELELDTDVGIAGHGLRDEVGVGAYGADQ